jgi:hypothetical protein
MTVFTSQPTKRTEEPAGEPTVQPSAPLPSEPDGRRWLPATTMIVLVSIGFLLPLLRNPDFYYWDDTVGAAVGVWQRIGSAILEGRLPFLELDMWRGGNLIGEAATGMWNPVMAGLMVATLAIDDLAVAIGVAKWAFFVIGALGVYFLARNYGAKRWWAALAGTALPLAGWALFVDGTAWINATAGAALLPWAWWGFRRAYLSGFRPGAISVAILTGYLLTSTGNPYSVITLAVVGLAIAVEAALKRDWRSILWVVALGAIVALLVVIVFIPFALTSHVGFRADSLTFNDEFLAPNISTLLGLSVPVYKPWIAMFGRPMTMPGTYLAWFVLPLLPWMRWRTARREWPALAGILTFAAFFLILALGPSQIAMFRWPARLIPFLYLAVMVFFVVILSRGLHRNRVALRASLTGVALLAGAWLAYSDNPALWKWIGLTTVVSAGLLVLAWFWGRSDARLFTVLAGGLILFIGAQIMVTPANANVANYEFIHSRSEIRDRFADRYEGLTVQVTQYGGPGIESGPDGIWMDFMPGNMPSVAQVESTTAYSGVGFTKLDQALCIYYNGVMCPAGWDALWERNGDEPALLADLLRAETVAVQRDFVDDLRTPQGWSIAEETENATVFTRDDALPFPDGRLSYVEDGLVITSDERQGPVDELIEFESTSGDGGALVFARLAWPGYTATVDGTSIPVETTDSGLVMLQVPADVSGGTIALSWSPPGLWIGIGAIALALAGWILAIIAGRRRARR